ncbi:MYND-type zinc finger protein samB AltName: Full=Suppressor of anucleate metulae protein B [Rhizoctonia solani AG-1 IB]|uniref:Rhizoctonia solani AG1-IB WGS project CAOJ00000000 data, isolate 7/3/14, contig 22579 n=1 Tax=Thanatephorus cucumeris (strain AG1-IB / isolate 7/3/14) TaxID=1108050 RepID=M5CBN7_THACB|nr:MYND-type zinc finger protein samB AltName: Full=Suppressor of anucleate metulae protein B [Rhizoctonia solani AG-1 IB]
MAAWSALDAAWIYGLSAPDSIPSDELPRRIDHRTSPTTYDLGDDDNSFFLESSSRAEIEKVAHRFKIGPARVTELAFQKPHPTAHSVPYIPTPGTPFPYQIDPLAARTFSLAFQCVVNIGVRGSEHIRRRVVQAGALGVVSCILAVWLKGKGFAIGPSATGSGAPRESREVRVRRREEALERQRALDLARALEHATSSDNLRARAIAQPQPRIATTVAPPPPLAPVRNNTNTNPSSEEADEEMSGASDMGPSPTPPPPVVGRSMSNDSDGSYAGVPSLPGPSGPSGAFAVSSGSHARSFDIRTASPIPIIPTSPVMGRAISPNTAQSSDASANATPVGSGTPTGSVVVPGRDRSGTVVGRPIWDTEGGPRQAVQQVARPTWSDADEAPTREVTTTGRRGTITRRPRRERDTDGDDTEADGDDQTAQQGERRTIGIVDAADGDGAMVMDMMGEGVGVGVVALEQNDDLAMGAPPGAPGAIGTPRARAVPGTELTPRAGIAPLGTQTEQAAPEARRPVPVNPGPYGDEEVLFSLQLLAYLSKYPHVRQAFYETPATLRALVDASNEPKPPAQPISSTAQSPNVFSLVERFTFRPSPSETTLPRLPHEIQYWAGVIMRNACRKDDQRGGIRQCANMLCGRWEEFPREFAKCRRCRKAKYCGKECQSKAWAEGHRFWCSAREEDDSQTIVARSSGTITPAPAAAVATEVEVPTRRGLTNTVTRALVNIAGGMTGRTNTNAQQPQPQTAPTNTPAVGHGPGFRFGAAIEQAQAGGQAQAQGLFGGTQGRPLNFQAGLPRGAGTAAAARGVRPLALPARAVNPASAGWTGPPRGGVAFFNEPAQPADAGPSRRARGPETARRRSGTMPSQGGSNQAAESNDPWNVVPVQRVSPVPSAPHTTPQHANRPLDGDGDDDMILG